MRASINIVNNHQQAHILMKKIVFLSEKTHSGIKIANLTFQKKSRFWRSKFLHWKSIKRGLPHLFIDAAIYSRLSDVKWLMPNHLFCIRRFTNAQPPPCRSVCQGWRLGIKSPGISIRGLFSYSRLWVAR